MALDSAGRYCLLKVLHGNAMDVDTLLKVFDRHLGKVVAVKRLRLDKRGPVPCAILRKYLQTELLTHRYVSLVLFKPCSDCCQPSSSAAWEN